MILGVEVGERHPLAALLDRLQETSTEGHFYLRRKRPLLDYRGDRVEQDPIDTSREILPNVIRSCHDDVGHLVSNPAICRSRYAYDTYRQVLYDNGFLALSEMGPLSAYTQEVVHATMRAMNFYDLGARARPTSELLNRLGLTNPTADSWVQAIAYVPDEVMPRAPERVARRRAPWGWIIAGSAVALGLALKR